MIDAPIQDYCLNWGLFPKWKHFGFVLGSWTVLFPSGFTPETETFNNLKLLSELN